VANGPAFGPLMPFINFRGEIIFPMNGWLHLKCQSHIIYFAGGQKLADGPAFGPLMPFINFGLLYICLCHLANWRFLTISVPVAGAPAIFIYCESN